MYSDLGQCPSTLLNIDSLATLVDRASRDTDGLSDAKNNIVKEGRVLYSEHHD